MPPASFSLYLTDTLKFLHLRSMLSIQVSLLVDPSRLGKIEDRQEHHDSNRNILRRINSTTYCPNKAIYCFHCLLLFGLRYLSAVKAPTVSHLLTKAHSQSSHPLPRLLTEVSGHSRVHACACAMKDHPRSCMSCHTRHIASLADHNMDDLHGISDDAL